MNDNNFDDLLNGIRNEQPDPAVEQEAANRVWARVSQHATIRGCADFQAMIPDWKAGTLTESRRVLLEDHVHGCVDCRKAAEAGRVLQFRRLAGEAPAPRRATIWQMPGMRLAMAAGLFIALGIGGWGVLRSIWSIVPHMIGSRATVQTADGQLFRLHGAGLLPLKAGEELPAGEEVRTGRNAHAVIRLVDGSLVEMRERSAFSVEESPKSLIKDVNVKLSRGAVIVQAAKRGKFGGHLYVTTPDCKVAVTGTVFSVDSGVKGSRVSVVEGEVHVTPESEESGTPTGPEVVLHPGDQTSTDASMERTSIRDEFSWSANSAQHLAMLADVVALQKDLEKIQQPGMRYSSSVLSRVPDGTVLYVAIPNISEQLGQAQEILAQRVKESPALQTWWNQQGEANGTFNKVLSSLTGFGSYLGDEVVVTAAFAPGPGGQMQMQAPVLMAQIKRSGLKEYAQSQFQTDAKGNKSVMKFLDDPSAAVSDASNDLLVAVSGDMLAITPSADAMRRIGGSMKAAAAGTPAHSGSPFLSRVEQSYQQGVGFLFAADLGTMSASVAGTGRDAQARIAPLGNVSYMMIEQRDAGTTTDTHAEVTFSGPRQGIFGWLGKPSPMAALDYVTASASAVSGFAVQSPGQVIDDMLAWTSANDPNAPANLAQLEQELGFSLRNDLAASLGSEFVVAFDGPLLPVPSWKVVCEVYDPQKLQWVFTQMVAASNKGITSRGGSALQTSQQIQGDLTFYKIVYPDATPLAEIDYTFTGGYVIMAPSVALLQVAIQAKQNGTSLQHSAAFRAALPHDRQANFSALIYQNLGTTVSSALDGLSATALGKQLGVAGRQKVQSMANEGAPTLIGAYGEEDRIIVSTQGLASLGSSSLLKLAGPFSMFSVMEHMNGTKGR